MKAFVAVHDDAALLGHFLKHYKSQGVGRFYIAVSRALARETVRLCRGFDVFVTDKLDVRESVVGGTVAVTALRLRYQQPDEWAVIADLDEFQEHPGGVRKTARAAQKEGANVVRGMMIDRVAADGGFPAIEARSDLWSLFPARCLLTKKLQGGVDFKCALVRGHLLPVMAHHHVSGEKIASNTVEIHHFKWNSTAVPRMKAAIGQIKDVGLSWHVEYERVLAHLKTHGRIRWQDFVEA